MAEVVLMQEPDLQPQPIEDLIVWLEKKIGNIERWKYHAISATQKEHAIRDGELLAYREVLKKVKGEQL